MSIKYPSIGRIAAGELYTQLFWQPPPPTTLFTNRTIIIIGANVGLGKEAAALFASLDAAKVIMTARTVARGEEAKASILASNPSIKKDAFEVWPIDLGDHASIRTFAARAAKLERLDHVVVNASIAEDKDFKIINGHEACVAVNVIGVFLLTLQMLPGLRAQAEKHDIVPTMSIVGSTFQLQSEFPQRHDPAIFTSLSNPATAQMHERYALSKKLQLLVVRELAARTAHWRPRVTINIVSPGFNKTSLVRNATGTTRLTYKVMHALLGWDPKVGARCLVHAPVAGHESHGVLLANCSIWNWGLGPWVGSEDGVRTQKRVWEEVRGLLEGFEPGVLNVLEK